MENEKVVDSAHDVDHTVDVEAPAATGRVGGRLSFAGTADHTAIEAPVTWSKSPLRDASYCIFLVFIRYFAINRLSRMAAAIVGLPNIFFALFLPSIDL
jgi:hypothetical protein